MTINFHFFSTGLNVTVFAEFSVERIGLEIRAHTANMYLKKEVTDC